jgi:hypothetical protein
MIRIFITLLHFILNLNGPYSTSVRDTFSSDIGSGTSLPVDICGTMNITIFLKIHARTEFQSFKICIQNLPQNFNVCKLQSPRCLHLYLITFHTCQSG